MQRMEGQGPCAGRLDYLGIVLSTDTGIMFSTNPLSYSSAVCFWLYQALFFLCCTIHGIFMHMWRWGPTSWPKVQVVSYWHWDVRIQTRARAKNGLHPLDHLTEDVFGLWEEEDEFYENHPICAFCLLLQIRDHVRKGIYRVLNHLVLMNAMETRAVHLTTLEWTAVSWMSTCSIK